MARARNIKPGFFRNADLVELSFETRLLFIGLWTIADRDGRMEDRPKQIKMELFPADNLDCDDLLNQLQKIGLIDRYEFCGKRYLHIVNFGKHQNPHRDEKPSTIPDKFGVITGTVQAQCKDGVPKDTDEQSAPCKHSAGTVQAQCRQEENTVEASCEPGATSVPIGLIPDSLLLIPDSLIPDSSSLRSDGASVREPTAIASTPPPAGAICKVLRQRGIGDAHPGHPTLRELIDAGAEIDEFLSLVPASAGKSKPFAWILKAMVGRRTDAKAMASGLHRGPMPAVGQPNKQIALEQRNRAVAAEWLASQGVADAAV